MVRKYVPGGVEAATCSIKVVFTPETESVRGLEVQATETPDGRPLTVSATVCDAPFAVAMAG